ncbi:MAG: hypothetical protein M1135_04240 [Candidatus Omnitrophica bacterium]|jgi:hypothetical protein|nr:hypothetical protein [Candidatus Omnitrophota bacterium]
MADKKQISKNMKTCIFILGMHRSGTSALAGTLNWLGVSMGKSIAGGDRHNIKGYWEDKKIETFNDYSLFTLLNLLDFDFRPMPKKWESDKKIISLIPEAKKIIQEEYSSSNIFGIKDPAICLLYPFWKNIMDELKIFSKVILLFRNPLEVANSLKKRDGFTFERSLLLCAKLLLYGEYYTRNTPRIFVNYDNVLNNTHQTIQKIESDLNIKLPEKFSDVNDKITRFLEKDLKHHNLAFSDLAKKIEYSTLPSFIFDIMEAYNNLTLGIIFDNETIRKNFDEWRNQYENLLNSKQIDNLLNIPPSSIQLSLDMGKNFPGENIITKSSEIKTIFPEKFKPEEFYPQELHKFIFNLSDKKNIESMKINLLNNAIAIIKDIKLIKNNNEEIHLIPFINKNYIYSHRNNSYFFTDALNIYFSNLTPALLKNSKQLYIEIIYIYKDEIASQIMIERLINSKIWKATEPLRKLKWHLVKLLNRYYKKYVKYG